MSVQKCIGKYFRVEFASSRPSMATPNHGISPIMFVPQEHLGVRNGWGREMANCFDHIAGSCVLVEENGFLIPRRDARGSRAHVPHRVLHFAQCGQIKCVLMAFDMAIAVLAHSPSNINFVD